MDSAYAEDEVRWMTRNRKRKKRDKNDLRGIQKRKKKKSGTAWGIREG